MKVERFIILVLLLLVVFFAYNKRPKHYRQTDHVIERLERVTDTLKVDVIKYKQKVKVVVIRWLLLRYNYKKQRSKRTR